jgi:serine O-acetyltransferase
MNHLTIGIKKLGKKKIIFPHPIGIVIGQYVNIGEKCIIYQNVTIGAKSIKDSEDKKYPTIGNNVFIGSHAVIIGNIIIGDNVVIGAASFVNKDIPNNTVVVGNPFKIIK